MAEWYSSFMSSGTNKFFKFQMLMVRYHGGLKKWGTYKKWYLPNYFRNSILDPIISKINANGPFCPFPGAFFSLLGLTIKTSLSLLGPFFFGPSRAGHFSRFLVGLVNLVHC